MNRQQQPRRVCGAKTGMPNGITEATGIVKVLIVRRAACRPCTSLTMHGYVVYHRPYCLVTSQNPESTFSHPHCCYAPQLPLCPAH